MSAALVDSKATARFVREALLAQPAPGRPQSMHEPAKVSMHGPAWQKPPPPQLTCTLDGNNEWLWLYSPSFLLHLASLILSRRFPPSHACVQLLLSICPGTPSPLTWALQTEAQRQEGTAQGHTAEKQGGFATLTAHLTAATAYLICKRRSKSRF